MTQAEAGATPVYRLYDPNGGQHHYTNSEEEKDMLVKLGWKLEAVAWYFDDFDKKEVRRMYNPNTGAHHFTTSIEERDMLVKAGWIDEGTTWKSI